MNVGQLELGAAEGRVDDVGLVEPRRLDRVARQLELLDPAGPARPVVALLIPVAFGVRFPCARPLALSYFGFLRGERWGVLADVSETIAVGRIVAAAPGPTSVPSSRGLADAAGGDHWPADDLAAVLSSAVAPDGAGSIVLVEGESERVALLALAIRRGLDLQRAGIEVAVLGGAQAIGPYLRDYRDRADRRRLSGLYDAGEETVFRRGLERHGFGELAGRRDLEERGFFCCDLDLEDELIRALGAPAVISVIAEQGDAQPFRTLQHQPEWRGRHVESQLRRFMGSGARRKIRYAKLLVDALDADRVPRPLDAVLQAALAPSG